jgi:enoyl-CoA hydratase/carnithine racemase
MSLIVTEDREGGVRHVVLNRPEKRNAFSHELVTATLEAVTAAARDPDVFVVVLRGEGPTFSAGVDVTGLGALAGGASSLRGFRNDWLDVTNQLETMTKPTIAVIQGAAIGGALETAIACDFRIMASDAIAGLPETKLGLIPDVGGSSRLAALVGLGKAKEMILTSRMLGAEEAERIGLVQRVVAPEDLEEATEALVDELLGCSPVAVGLAKRVIDHAAKPALANTLEHEVTAQQVCVASEDFKEAAMAYMEKRRPEFSGK